MRKQWTSIGTLVVISMAVLSVSAPVRAENLMPNPSFEELLPKPDSLGHFFVGHGGRVFDQPGRMAVGTIAHSGKYSYEIIDAKGGKTRYRCSMKLEPGRYRASAYIRGLNIVGTYKSAMEASYFDGKYYPLKVPQTFGWTPITHVFDVAKPIEGDYGIGLWGSGWLWIDDVSLEKVDDSVALTPAPVLGKEAPIAPPGKLAADAFHCPACGYRNNPDWNTCYACGTPLTTKTTEEGPAVKVLYDFEDGKVGPFTGGEITTENVPQGRYALTAAKGDITNATPQDWSGYDFLKIDVFNPQDEPVMVGVELRDTETTSYWTRVNYSTVVPPGKSTISIPTDMYVGEKGRPGRPLINNKVNFLGLLPQKRPVVFDNIRLERLDTSGVLFNELNAFDFGTQQSPVMPGYTVVTEDTIYSEGRGYGWTRGQEWLRGFDGMQPDALFEDFVVVSDGSFQVDVPNGKYHVIMNIDSPGGFWGEVQQYTHRQVLANGVSAVDEKMTFDDFKKRYFRDAHTEDVPGLDTFAKYVETMFDVKQFDVNVTDGKVVFDFKGDGRWPIALSALVLYP